MVQSRQTRHSLYSCTGTHCTAVQAPESAESGSGIGLSCRATVVAVVVAAVVTVVVPLESLESRSSSSAEWNAKSEAETAGTPWAGNKEEVKTKNSIKKKNKEEAFEGKQGGGYETQVLLLPIL